MSQRVAVMVGEQYRMEQLLGQGGMGTVYPLNRGVNALRKGDAENAQRWLTEAEPYIQKTQDILGWAILGGLTARCWLAQGRKTEALLRAQETLELYETNRLSIESAGEGLSAVVEVYLSLWEAGSAADRQQLAGPLRRSLAAMRRCEVARALRRGTARCGRRGSRGDSRCLPTPHAWSRSPMSPCAVTALCRRPTEHAIGSMSRSPGSSSR